MFFTCHFTASSRRISASITLLALAVLLSGCDKGDGDEPAQASFETSATVESRPPELVGSYTALQSGQPAQAFTSAHTFLQAQPDSPYRAEALYLCGQSLAAQGEFERGKKFHEEAIERAQDRNLKALAMLGRADCNYGMGNYSLASRQYHWLQTMYKGARPLHQDEIMFKLGMSSKKAGNGEWADYWFNQVNELYNTGPYAERARAENSHFTPPLAAHEKPLVYYLDAYEFGKPEKAEEAAGALRSKGYRDVEVVKTTRSKQVVYEVHVGKFNNRVEAGRAQVDAKLEGLSTSVRPGTVEPMK